MGNSSKSVQGVSQSVKLLESEDNGDDNNRLLARFQEEQKKNVLDTLVHDLSMEFKYTDMLERISNSKVN